MTTTFILAILATITASAWTALCLLWSARIAQSKFDSGFAEHLRLEHDHADEDRRKAIRSCLKRNGRFLTRLN